MPEERYFRSTDSKIRFVVDHVNVRSLSVADRAVLLLLRFVTWIRRKREARLFRKIEAAIQHDDQPALMILYARLAELYSALGYSPTQLEVLKQSVRLAERLEEWPFAATMSYWAGDCAWDLELDDQAIDLQKKTLEFAQRAGDRNLEADACERLGMLFESRDPGLSRQMLARYHELGDSGGSGS